MLNHLKEITNLHQEEWETRIREIEEERAERLEMNKPRLGGAAWVSRLLRRRKPEIRICPNPDCPLKASSATSRL